MIILTLRTDKPEAEIGFFDDDAELAYIVWHAHRELAETLHAKIKALLENNKLTLKQLEGIAVYKGPGSFTGLRIGATVANALADSLHIPIVSATGEDWAKACCASLAAGKNERAVQPKYGADPHITQQKK